MKAYGGRCAVTGCAVPELLDAAHLMPWRIADEGILLRVDIHRMIDRGLAGADVSGCGNRGIRLRRI